MTSSQTNRAADSDRKSFLNGFSNCLSISCNRWERSIQNASNTGTPPSAGCTGSSFEERVAPPEILINSLSRDKTWFSSFPQEVMSCSVQSLTFLSLRCTGGLQIPAAARLCIRNARQSVTHTAVTNEGPCGGCPAPPGRLAGWGVASFAPAVVDTPPHLSTSAFASADKRWSTLSRQMYVEQLEAEFSALWGHRTLIGRSLQRAVQSIVSLISVLRIRQSLFTSC